MIEFVGQREPVVSPDRGNGSAIQSTYLEYLPALYRDSEFMGRFLLIFESVLGPIENMVGSLPLYFDPCLTPEPFLPWLASWLDLVLDTSVTLDRRRELVGSAAELYRWRGTRRGLSEYIRVCTGVVPEISEYIPGMRLGPDTKLGIDTQLGSSGVGYRFTVTLKLNANDTVRDSFIKAIIDSQKPAHTTYTLQIVRT
jgi:phage tail-like protein